MRTATYLLLSNTTQPCIFQDFDLFNFYRVSEEELNKEFVLFRSGRYEFQYEQAEFDMAEHNKMLEQTKDEVKEIRKKQREVQEEMIQAEQDSLAKWRKDKENQKVDEGTVESLLAGQSTIRVVQG